MAAFAVSGFIQKGDTAKHTTFNPEEILKI